MSKTTLHYIHDPLGGWCYGAAPLVRVARGLVHVQAHGGGMMAADEVAGAGLDMLVRLQQAHYVEGRRVAEVAVLKELAAELGLGVDAFSSAYDRLEGAATQAHMEQSRALLARIGGQGFPPSRWSSTGTSRSWTSAPTSASRTHGAPGWHSRWAVPMARRTATRRGSAASMVARCEFNG